MNSLAKARALRPRIALAWPRRILRRCRHLDRGLRAGVLVLMLIGPAAVQATDSDLRFRLIVTAMINESIMPVARGEKYGQPLDAYLVMLDVGEVVGGGTALGPAGGPEWVEIVIELNDGEQSVAKVARKLKALGAPPGSFLHYQLGEERQQVPIE